MARATGIVTTNGIMPTPTFDGGGHAVIDTQATCALPTNTSGQSISANHNASAAGSFDGCGQTPSDTHHGDAATTCEEGEGHRPYGTQSRLAPSLLNTYVGTYEAAQALRKETMNRVRCWVRDRHPSEEWAQKDFSDKDLFKLDDSEWPAGLREFVQHIAMMEESVARVLRREMRKHPLWPWLGGVRGMGEILGGRLLHRVGDIYRFPSPAHLWSYCGLDGVGWRSKKHSWALTSICYNIADSFQKQPALSGGYRDIYDARKEYEASKPACGPDECPPTKDKKTGQLVRRDCQSRGHTDRCTPAHINNKARRYAVKMFLKDLWRHAHGYTVLEREEAAS